MTKKKKNSKTVLYTNNRSKYAHFGLFWEYSSLRNVGDNDFAVEHTGVRKRQREGTLENVVKYDKDALERAYAWMASSPSDDEDD